MSTGVRGPGWGPRQQGIAAPFCVGQCSRDHRSPACARWTHWLRCLGLFYNTESRLKCTRGAGIGGCLSKRRAYEERVLSRRAMARGFVTCTAENQAKTDRRSRDDLQRHCTSRPREGAQEVCAALCRAGPAKPRRFAVQSVRLINSRCGTMPSRCIEIWKKDSSSRW
jgi:hypothetical protein